MSSQLLRAALGVLSLFVLAIGSLGAQTPGVTKDVIRIGIPGPFTGDSAAYSTIQMAMEAYFKEVNSQGGIHGRRFEVIRGDDACDEAKGIAAIRKLIYQDNVFLLNGVSCSGVGIAARPIIIQSGIPFIVGAANAYQISSPLAPNIFHAVPTSIEAGKAMAKFAASKPGTTKVAVIRHSNEWAKSYAEPAIEELKKHYGLDPILDVQFERGSTDATPQVLKLKDSGAQIIFGVLYPAETAIFLRDAKKYGLTTPVVGTLGTDLENTLQRVGDIEAVKNYYTLHTLSDISDGPKMDKWRRMYQATFPNEKVYGYTFAGLGGSIAIVQALRAVGPDLTREKFIDALNQIRDLNTDVLAGHITFTKEDHNGVKDVAVAGFVNGKPALFKSFGVPY